MPDDPAEGSRLGLGSVLSASLVIAALVAAAALEIFFLTQQSRCSGITISGRVMKATPDALTVTPGGSAMLTLWVRSEKDGPLRMEGPAFLKQMGQVVDRNTDATGNYVYDQTLLVAVTADETSPPGQYHVTFVYPHNRQLLAPWAEVAAAVTVRVEK